MFKAELDRQPASWRLHSPGSMRQGSYVEYWDAWHSIHKTLLKPATEDSSSRLSTKFATHQQPQATPKIRCLGDMARTHDLGTVHHKSGQRLRIASRRTWAPKGAREASGATDCRITIPYEAHKGWKGLFDRYSLSGSYLTNPPLYKGSHRKEEGWMMRRTMLLVLTAALVMALMMVAMAFPVFAGGAGDDEDNDNESANGDATRNSLIVFRRWFDPDQTKSALFVMNPDGSHIRQITHPPKGWRDDAPTSSPDGKHVAFYRQRIDESMSRIMVLNLQTGGVREVTHCGPNQGQPKQGPWSMRVGLRARLLPRWSFNFLSSILGPDRDCCRIEGIWIIGLNGSNPHQVTNVDPKLPEAFSDWGSAFSPDGKRLVFDRARVADEHHAVFVQPIDSSGSPEDARRITPWKLNCQDRPEYSPDGKLVLFRCLPKGEQGPSNLYWVHPDGTGLHQLTQGAAGKRFLAGCSRTQALLRASQKGKLQDRCWDAHPAMARRATRTCFVCASRTARWCAR